MRSALTAFVATVAMVAVAAVPAQADPFALTGFDGEVLDQAGKPASQAGGHPHTASTTFSVATHPANPMGFPIEIPNEDIRDVEVDLPLGFVGNPTATPTRCREDQLAVLPFGGHPNSAPPCPPTSQVGTVEVKGLILGADTSVSVVPLYNMVPPKGVAAQFGFRIISNPVHIDAMVRPEDNGIRVVSRNLPQTLAVAETTVTLWGVPGDPSHDADRGRACLDAMLYGGLSCDGGSQPAGYASTPFVTNPTACTAPGVGVMTGLRTTSWGGSSDSASFESHDNDGNPLGPTGCDALPFEPSLEVAATSRQADAPTGLEVDLAFPQPQNPKGLSPAHLKRAEVTLPEGMTVNPAGAGGLEACRDEQLGLGTDAPLACPEASKVGTVTATTPLLTETLSGGVYVRTQASDDPESGDMFRLALVLENEERGISVRLPGSVRADSETGRLVTTFDNNPQVPVSNVRLKLKGGPRAPLAMPTSCGQKTIEARLASWGGQEVVRKSSFQVDCESNLGGFEPTFQAGTSSPIAGTFSPFAVSIVKPDRDDVLSDVEVELPPGLVATLKGNLGARVGEVQAFAGPGTSPYMLPGSVFLEGPYGGAPFSLKVVVPAKAGPFDLGEVVVRQRVLVDPVTAQVTVASDPLPTIVKGVPVRLQRVDVDVDRPGFVVNPTSCRTMKVGAMLRSLGGLSAARQERFQVADCAGLAFKPRLSMRLTGKGQTRTGRHPGLRTVVTQGQGESNIGQVKVTMPRSVALDPHNTVGTTRVCDYDASLRADCPENTIIGNATAITPVLDKPLSGPVYLVQGIKFGKAGNRIRTTPSLLVKLRGQVAIDLRGQTSTQRGSNLLVTTFPAVPDAPVSKFTLSVKGGSKGILVVTATREGKIDICASRQIAAVDTHGHNGRQTAYRTPVRTPCAKAPKAHRVKRGTKPR